jgi:hypothetical protein
MMRVYSKAVDYGTDFIDHVAVDFMEADTALSIRGLCRLPLCIQESFE